MVRFRSLAAVVLVALSACGDNTSDTAEGVGESAPIETSSPLTVASSTAPATLPTSSVATTSLPPTAVSSTVAEVATTTAEVVEEPDMGEPWDVLYLDFEDLYTSLPAELYTERAAAALGTEVRLTHPPGWGHVYASNLVQQLRDERFPWLGEAARGAEIIVLLSRPDAEAEGPMAHINDDYLRCSWLASIGDPLPDRSASYWEPYRDALDKVYAEIWAVRDGLPTMLVSIDFYPLDLPALEDAGIDEECLAWWEEWSNEMRAAAEANGAVMVSVFDLFTGPDHDLDPAELGLTGPTDVDPSSPRYRVTPAGAALIADALVAVGFEPSTGP